MDAWAARLVTNGHLLSIALTAFDRGWYNPPVAKAFAWLVCTCPEHDDGSVPCEGILIFAEDPHQALALAWCDLHNPGDAIVSREPLADAYTHLAVASAIPRPTHESPAPHVRIWRRIGYCPLNNGNRCNQCSLAEWSALDESQICPDCGLCEECHPDEEEG